MKHQHIWSIKDEPVVYVFLGEWIKTFPFIFYKCSHLCIDTRFTGIAVAGSNWNSLTDIKKKILFPKCLDTERVISLIAWGLNPNMLKHWQINYAILDHLIILCYLRTNVCHIQQKLLKTLKTSPTSFVFQINNCQLQYKEA